jgi:hypothetical protein
MNLIDAARQALDALEAGPDVDPIFAGETIAALKAALDVVPPEHERLAAFQAQADRDTRLLMRAHKEALRQRDYWQEEAKRYAGNTDFWKSKSEALEQPTSPPDLLRQEQTEPVAWMVYTLDGKSVCVTDNPADFTDEHRVLPLFTLPPIRRWQKLTDQDISDAYIKWDATPGVSMADFARDIEKKLRAKNK